MAELLLTPNRNGHASPPKLLGPDGKEVANSNGDVPLAHYANFAAIWNQFNQTYSYRYDEAIKNSWENKLSMRRDVFIWALLDERYRAVTQSPWYVDHPDDEDTGETAVAGELEELIRAIPRLTGMFRNLEDAFWYGRFGSQFATGPCEANGVPQIGIVHHVPVNGDKIQVGWDGIPRVMINPTKAVEYEQRGWHIQRGEQSTQVVLDRPELRERFAINQYDRDDADYYEGDMGGMVGGVGIRSRIYWAWWLRQEMLGWAVNYMRKVGTLGLLVFPFAEGNPESEAAAEENIKQAGNRSSLMVPVPNGSDPKQVAPFVISPSNAGIDSLTSMIDSYWERHIERLIVGQNMSDGSESGNALGGSGRAEFASQTKYDKIKGDADTLAETLTRDLLKPLHRWNYAGQRFVYRFVFGVKDPQSAEKLEAGIKLASVVEIKADELREAGGYTKPKPGDDIVGGGMAAPNGLGLDGQPLDKPFKPGPFGGSKQPGQQSEPDSDGGDAENMQRDAMNDAQFAAAMDRLGKLEERLIEQRQQNYVRSNDDAVTLLSQRVNDLAMQRYQSGAGGVQLHLPKESSFSMPNVKIEGLEELVAEIRQQKAPTVENIVNVPEQAAPKITVENVVNVPQQNAPAVNNVVNVPQQERPIVNINVPEPSEYEETSEIVRDDNGLIKRLLRKLKRKR